MKDHLVLGTRASALALAQAELTRRALASAFSNLQIEMRTFTTRGDRKMDLSLLRSSEAGGKGLFTKELEDALLAGEIDVAVHSLKDLPGNNPAGLHITAVLERAPTADLLVSKHSGGLTGLPSGSRVGTSSIRRARQLKWRRPDLIIVEWRGNVQTRLRKLGEAEDVAGILLAQAGLERLGFPVNAGVIEAEQFRFHTYSLAETLFPAIGQGAIALQSRAGDAAVDAFLSAVNHPPTLRLIRAERELQRLLAGDCTLPVGVRTESNGGRLRMSVILFGAEADAPQLADAEGDAEQPELLAGEVFKLLEANGKQLGVANAQS